jgi:hypothetical protein
MSGTCGSADAPHRDCHRDARLFSRSLRIAIGRHTRAMQPRAPSSIRSPALRAVSNVAISVAVGLLTFFFMH